MEFFLDTADIKEIETGLEWGMVDGITTNPTLIAKQGRPYLQTVQEIARLVPGPVSGEVLATEFDEMMEQGRRLAGLAENVVVKVPLTPAGLRAVRELLKEGIRCNVTLCFSAAQALLAAKAGAAYISPFVGRLDDVAEDGMVAHRPDRRPSTAPTTSTPRCWSPRCATRCTSSSPRSSGPTWPRCRSRSWSSSTSTR